MTQLRLWSMKIAEFVVYGAGEAWDKIQAFARLAWLALLCEINTAIWHKENMLRWCGSCIKCFAARTAVKAASIVALILWAGVWSFLIAGLWVALSVYKFRTASK